MTTKGQQNGRFVGNVRANVLLNTWQDNEYERRGTITVFYAIEPRQDTIARSLHQILGPRKVDKVVGESPFHYMDTTTIHLVLENLNIHRGKSLTENRADVKKTEVPGCKNAQ